MAMPLSLNKLPWHGQLGALALVCLGAVGSFYYFYAQSLYTDIATRETRLAGLRADIVRGRETAHRLPEFEAQVNELEQRLQTLQAMLPDQKDVADILRRLQGLATESNLSIQRFTPQPSVQQAMYAEVPFKIQAEGTYHNLGAFLDRISRFPRIINITNINIKARPKPEPNATIVAECVATTFVSQDAGRGKPGAAKPAPAPK
jgi:type IV pilus assembly protein PilO